MSKFRCLIETPSGFLKWEEVDAINYEDARAQVSAVNAGTVLSVGAAGTPAGQVYRDRKSTSSTSSCSHDEEDGEAILGFLAFVAISAIIYIAIIAWPILLVIAAIFILYKVFK
jgi:hypothetical protein